MLVTGDRRRRARRRPRDRREPAARRRGARCAARRRARGGRSGAASSARRRVPDDALGALLGLPDALVAVSDASHVDRAAEPGSRARADRGRHAARPVFLTTLTSPAEPIATDPASDPEAARGPPSKARNAALADITVGAGTATYTITATGAGDTLTLADNPDANSFTVTCSCGDTYVFVDAAALTTLTDQRARRRGHDRPAGARHGVQGHDRDQRRRRRRHAPDRRPRRAVDLRRRHRQRHADRAGRGHQLDPRAPTRAPSRRPTSRASRRSSGAAASTASCSRRAARSSNPLNGGAGTDELIAKDIDNAWVIDGANTGTLNGFRFNAIEQLVGGNLDDTFTLTTAGSIGSIAGGFDADVENPSHDTLDLSAFSTPSS